MKHERHCMICGKAYSYCNNCYEYDGLPRWMFMFHDENCRDIWRVFNAYRNGSKDATETKQALEKLDLSQKEKFDDVFKAVIKEVYEKAEPQPVIKKDEPFIKRDFKKNK